MAVSAASRPSDSSALLPALAFSGWAVALALFSLTVIDPFKYIAAEHLAARGGVGQLPALFLRSVTAPGWAVIVALGLLSAATLWFEAFGRRISRSLVDGPRAGVGLVLACFLLWVGHCYLTPGWLIVGDANAHIARVALVADSLRDGRSLSWDNYWYGGTPVFQFTGPIFFWLAGALAFLVGDPHLATKAVLFACHLLSGGLFYGFLRAVGIGRLGALLAALLYAGSFGHLYLSFFRSSYPQALSFALVPGLFWLTWTVLQQRRFLSWSWLGLCLLFVLSLANHQPTGLFAGLLVTLFCLGTFLAGVCPWTRMVPLALCGALALLLSAPFVVPVFAENRWTVAGGTPAGLWLAWPDLATWKTLVLWRAHETGDRYFAYLNLVTVGLAIAGLASLRRVGTDPVRARLFLTFALLLLVSLVLRVDYLRPLQFILFGAALLAALGADRLASRGRNWASAILVLVVFDLSSTAIYPLPRTDKGYFADAAQAIVQHFPERRIVVVDSISPIEIPIGPNGGILARYPVQKLDGPHNITVPLTHNYLVTLLKLAELDLGRQKALSPATRRLLCLTNVAALVRITPDATGLEGAVPGTTPVPGLGDVLRLDCATPVLVAPALARLAPPPDLDQPTLWNDSTFSPDSPERPGRIARFLGEALAATGDAPSGIVVPTLAVRALPDPAAAGPILTTARMTAYRVRSDRVSLTLVSDGDGYARLAHPWYPALRVTRNGQEVAALRDPIDFMVVPITAGENRIEIVPFLTPLRRWTLWGSLTGIGLLALLVAVATRRPHTP